VDATVAAIAVADVRIAAVAVPIAVAAVPIAAVVPAVARVSNAVPVAPDKIVVIKADVPARRAVRSSFPKC